REYELQGTKVRVEKENWMRVTGDTVVLTGKPDLNAQVPGMAAYELADGKTGNPRKKDWWQGLLYTYMLPKSWGNASISAQALIFYKSGQEIPIAAAEFTPELKKHAFGILRRLGESAEPEKTPSYQECRFCDVLQCEDRVREKPDETPNTTDF